MDGVIWSRIQKALKTWYLDGFKYQMNEKVSPFYAEIEKKEQQVEGSKVVMALRYGRNGGVGNRDDIDDLPKANSRKTENVQWETKNIFAKIQITDKTIKASKSNRGSFVRLLEQEITDAMNDAKDNMNRQLFGNGLGVMAVTAAHTDVNTVTVSDTKFFFEGQYIDITDNVGTVKAALREVTIVDRINSTITFDGAAQTTLATDLVVISGNYGKELTGLLAVFTPDTTLYGLDRATHKWMNPIIIDLAVETVAQDLGEVDIQKGLDTAETQAATQPNFLLSSFGVRRAYQKLQIAGKRTVNTLTLKGGWKVLEYNGMPFVADKYAPSNQLHMLDKDDWALYSMEGWDWLNKDGNVLTKVDNKAAYWATLVNYCDLGCSKIGGQVLLKGIKEY